MSDKVITPGVYRSSKPEHILVLRWNPTSVTCLSCAELCSRADVKSMKEFKAVAEAFTAKHGYLEELLADKIQDIIK